MCEMRMPMRIRLIALLSLAILAGCESARLPVEAGMGSTPQLPPPNKALIPTVVVATATG